MKLTKIAIAMLCVASTTGMSGVPFASTIQETTSLADKEAKLEPFKGKVDAVSTADNNITVGGTVYQISTDTKLTKDGKTIMLADIKVGDQVHGLAAQSPDGKKQASKLMVVPSKA
jgi:hypothetical protein